MNGMDLIYDYLKKNKKEKSQIMQAPLSSVIKAYKDNYYQCINMEYRKWYNKKLEELELLLKEHGDMYIEVEMEKVFMNPNYNINKRLKMYKV